MSETRSGRPVQIRIWADTARSRPNQRCRAPGCGVPLWFVQTVKSGKWIPLDTEPVALTSEPDREGREMWLIDADAIHFVRCCSAQTFRRSS